MSFCHLHVHSEYSMLDGLCRLPELVRKAAELGMPALSLTDHGGLWGVVPFYKLCLEAKIKPILGCEVYVVENLRKKEGKENPHHLVLLAENQEGYQNLIKLITISHLEGFYYRPRLDKEQLAAYSKGLIALSGCLKGEVADYILKGDMAKAKQAVTDYAEIFGKHNFYLELQDHGLMEQKKINFWLKNFAKEFSLRLVATNDVHYLEPEDSRIHNVLLSVQTMSVVEEALSLPGNQYYLKSERAMKELFPDVPEAIQNSAVIASRCNVKLKLGHLSLPEAQVPSGYDTNSFLEKLAFEGAKKHYGSPLPSQVFERLAYELSTIKKTGFAGYFLIVKDIVDFAVKQEIPVGVGRGSAPGSLVAYCLGITDVDPIKYGLIFERFLNPERVSPPDIDIDLCHVGRRHVLDHIRKRFGHDKIAHAGAFSTLQARAVLRDTGRALKLDYSKIDQMCSLVPYSHMTLQEVLHQSPHLSSLVRRDPDVRLAFKIAMHLQGLPRHMTQHSAGVVIAKETLTKYAPLQQASGQEIITQVDMDMLEDLGLVKIDLLGLRFLTVIGNTLKFAYKRHGIKLSPKDIPLDDPKTYAALCRGDTNSTFQLESCGMRNLLRKIRPQNIEDLSAVLALYRPGPLNSGMTEEFIARRLGKKEVSFPHPCLEPVLRDTYGVFVYQEQLMQAAQAVAGYTLGEADLLRRAIAKKDKKTIENHRPRFIKQATYRGIDKETAEKIFSILEAFGDYGFNKSHSISYAIMAYKTVFLKEHFTLEYFAALLSLYADTPSRLQLYLSEARRKGIKLLRPDINQSEVGFTPEYGTTEADNDNSIGSIRTGLCMVKNLGPQGVKQILKARQERPFTDFFDFCLRIDRRAVGIRALESLILAGAFDSFGISRPALLLALKPATKQKRAIAGQLSLFAEESHIKGLAEDVLLPDFSFEQKAYHELCSLGHYVTFHPMELQEEWAKGIRSHTVQEVSEICCKKKVRLAGILLDTRFGLTRNKSRMMFVQLEDLTGSIELVVFPKELKFYRPYLVPGAAVLVDGWVDLSDDGHRTVIVEKVRPLTKPSGRNEEKPGSCENSHNKAQTMSLSTV